MSDKSIADGIKQQIEYVVSSTPVMDEVLANLCQAWHHALLAEQLQGVKPVTFNESAIFKSPSDIMVLREVLVLQDTTHWPPEYKTALAGMSERIESLIRDAGGIGGERST